MERNTKTAKKEIKLDSVLTKERGKQNKKHALEI